MTVACRASGAVALFLCHAAIVGCYTPEISGVSPRGTTVATQLRAGTPPPTVPPAASPHGPTAALPGAVRLVSDSVVTEPKKDETGAVGSEAALAELVMTAWAANPQLRRMQAEANAEWNQVPQVRSLPDPMARGTLFGEPMMMADGETRATFMISQTLPFWKLLDARGQQATFRALVLEQEVQTARLRIAADVKEAWFRLYLLGQLLKINEANRELVAPLVQIATGRVEVGETTPGDVLLATLELSRIEEERLLLRQQLASRQAILNQLLDRPSDSPLPLPETVGQRQAPVSLEDLRAVAFQQQPEIAAARLRTEAAVRGIEVAGLQRVPEVTLSYEHMVMAANPGMEGADPWQVGVAMNLPIWRRKYAALEGEARERHAAAHESVAEAIRANDTMLLDYLEQARAAEATARLYRENVLPQARQAFEVDQQAYGQGAVQFERVISDARNWLAAEATFHRAIVDQAIAVARLDQAVGADESIAANEAPTSAPTGLLPTAE